MESNSVTTIFRIGISAIVMIAAFYFAYWVPLALLPIPWGFASVLAYGAAMVAGWYAWTRTASVDSSLARSVGYWALVIGAIGFAGGFFGPLIFTPEANQGPLLGILITGPLGVVAGAIGGLIYWMVQRRRGNADAAT